MSTTKILTLVVSMAPFVLGAQNLVKNGDAETGVECWPKGSVQAVAEKPHAGASCFKTATTHVVSTEIIPIDGAKTYKISGWFKSADDKKADLYFGLSPLDADKKTIIANYVNVMPGTETELAAACKPEDTVIKVKDGSKWDIKDKYSHVAFEVDNSGEYKDLPNKNISAGVITKVDKKDNLSEVTFDKPCGMTFPAGSKVRIHKDGGYMYPVYAGGFQSPDWKEFSAEIKGSAKFGCGGQQFWPGTQNVQILVLSLNGGMVFFDDLKLEEKK